MNEPRDADFGLERLIERTLRDLPPRRAPTTLESRVFAELARRAAQPWWRRSFTHWPGAARAAFVSMSVCLAGLAFVAGGRAVAGFNSMHAFHPWSMPGVRQAAMALSGAQWAAGELSRAIPSGWIYGGLVVGAALYATLFGLGTAAYRALFLQHHIAGDYQS